MTSTLPTTQADVKCPMLYVGVDLALERNVVVVLDAEQKRKAHFDFPHSAEGYASFHRQLQTLRQRCAATPLVGMEPTNYLWKLLATDLEQRGVPYRLVNPYTVRKYREGSHLDRSRDDLRDAQQIAELLRNGTYTATRLLRGPYAELRGYVTLADRLQKDIARQRLLVGNLAGQLFPELASVFHDPTKVTALALLRSQPAAALIRQQSWPAFLAGVRAQAPGRRLHTPKLKAAYALAEHSVGLTEGLQAAQTALRVHIATLELLRQQQHDLGQQLTQCFLAFSEAPYLLSLPHLGLPTAATILAEIGDPRHFHNGRQLVKLAGLQPVPDRSGRKNRTLTPMSHQGRSRLRRALYFAVLRLLRFPGPFRRQYEQLQQRADNPLCKMQAIGVLMQRLLRILWALIKQRAFYRPAA